MQLKRLGLSFGGVILAGSLLAACGGTAATNTAAPATSARPSAAASASSAASAASSSAAASAAPTRVASPSAGAASPSAGAASPAASPTRAGSPVVGTPGTPGAGLSPSQAYVRLQGQPSHRQRWSFTGFTIAGLSGNLAPVFDVVGNNRKVTLSTAGTNIEAYSIGGALSVQNPVGGGFVTADASNPLTAPVQALFALPDTLIFTLAPVNGSYTAQPAQTVNGRSVIPYRTQVQLADLAFVSPTLAGQQGTANTIVYLDSTAGFLVALESQITATGSSTAASARLDVTDIGQVPAIAVPK